LGYNLVLNRGQKDLAAGAAWSGKAAEQGHPQAQYYLGILYAFGQGLPQSAQQARHWLLEAKANGFTKAGNVITFLEGGYAQPVKVQNPRTGDQMEITVMYNDPFSALGLLSQDRDLTSGVLRFQIRYHLKSPYPFCHVKPEGYGFEYSGGFPALKEKEGITSPYIARDTEGILNDNVKFVMYYEQTNQDNVKQRVTLAEAEVPVVAVWL
jgi:hypothetical protein